MRLNRYIAKAGIASRRKADLLIEDGHVSINGRKVTELGTQVDENKDSVEVDGKVIKIASEFIYLMLNKPVSYLVTARDEFGRATIFDLIPKYRRLVTPVGRLDYNSSGLLLLTNDGGLAFRLTHPRYEIDKTYQVECTGSLNDAEITRLEQGIEIEGVKTSPAKIELISRAENFSRINITIHEGRKRQVRLMCAALGHNVRNLKRISLGNLQLGELKEGRTRPLSKDEITGLKNLVSL